MPKKLNIPGIDLAWTSDDILKLDRFPNSILIVGGDILPVNLHLFSGIWAEVTQLIRGQHLLNGFDEDLSLCLEESHFTDINIISNTQ